MTFGREARAKTRLRGIYLIITFINVFKITKLRKCRAGVSGVNYFKSFIDSIYALYIQCQ